jgi:hypothetical protein
MARDETDREDLLREATALVERVELAMAADDAADDHVVIGFRRAGDASFFFGADPVYHFNAAGELRRAYCGGLLYKAERGRLVSLERVRTSLEVRLIRHELNPAAQADFVARMRDRLFQLTAELEWGGFQMVGKAPEDADVLGRIRTWLREHAESPIAQTPNATRN